MGHPGPPLIDEGFPGGVDLLVGLMGECIRVGLVDDDVVGWRKMLF